MNTSRRDRIGLALVGLLTVGFLASHTAFSVVDAELTPSYLVGLIAPVLLVCMLAYAGVRFERLSTAPGDVYVFSLWFVGGALVFGLAALATFLYQISAGGTIVRFWEALVNWTIGGAAIGVLVGSYDVHRRISRRDLQTARQRASVLNRVLRHDVRNQLNIIDGHLGLVALETPEERRAAGTIRDSVEHLNRVAERARYIDRVIDEDAQLSIDVAAILGDHAATLAERYPGARIETRIPETIRVQASPELRTALWEPLENAVVHNDQPTPHVEVTVTPAHEHAANRVAIEIRDNGPGLPELENVVFEEGEESQLTHSQGTGLWLFRIVCQNSDAAVTVDSPEGGGLVLSIQFSPASESTPLERLVPESLPSPVG